MAPSTEKEETRGNEASKSNVPSQMTGSGSRGNDAASMQDSSFKDFSWMIKPCLFYKEEFNDCKSLRARFHQYYTEGKTWDCTQWNKDYSNCIAYAATGDEEAKESLIASEKHRFKTRMMGHMKNNVWSNRTSPPEEFFKELPSSIKQGYKGSFLQSVSDKLKTGEETLEEPSDFSFDVDESRCSIV